MKELLPSRSVPLAHNFLWIGVGISFFYWFLESLMHVTVFGGSDFLGYLLIPDAHELWKRLLVIFLVILFSLYTQRSINVRRRAEASLANREKEISRVLESNPAGILMVDAESRKVSWANANALKMIGAPEENVIGEVCHKYLCPAETGKCPVLDKGQPLDLSEGVLLTAAGGQLPILKSFTRVEYMEREHLLETFFDISYHKRILQELQVAHAELDQIFQTASVALRLVDVNFNVLRINRTYECLTGVNEAYGVGKKCHEIFPGSTCHTEQCSMHRLRNGEKSIVNFEVRKKLQDGKMIDCLLDATPFTHSNGEMIGIVESFRDITELKKARDAIASERDKLQRILSHLQEGVGIINGDHVLEYRNGIFVDYFGDNPTWNCHEAVYGKSRPCEPCLMHAAFETGCVQRTEKQIPEGKSFEITYTPVTDINGSQKVVGLWRDVTEKEAAVSAMVRSEQLAVLGELAAGVAHEIYNPINGIINYAQILVNDSAEGSMVRDIAGRVIREGERIDRIVEGLLSFARRQKDEKSVVSVADILADSITLNASQLRKDNIRVIQHVQGELPDIWAQPQEIAQVFVNIISNARHALNEKYPESHEDKILEITVELVTSDIGPRLRICFKDHGCGIPAAIIDKVMIPFFSTKDERKRTGLGLSISQSILEEHRGSLQIESEEGQYTSVVVEIPANLESNQ